jgi:AraC family transcriptional regulator
MLVASVLAYGEAPEAQAWQSLRLWAIPKGLLNDSDRHPIFGFNNPNPSPDRAGYGYELWIRVDAPEGTEEAVAFREFEGGLFAVTACRLHGDPDIPTTWRMLWDWTQGSRYHWRRAQELEKVLNPNAPEDELVLELYLPVAETAVTLESQKDPNSPAS